MKHSEESTPSRIAGFVAITLFIGTFIYLSVVLSVNKRMEEELQESKLELEMLLSEKLSGQKRIVHLTRDLSELEKECKARMHELDSLLEILAGESKAVNFNSLLIFL